MKIETKDSDGKVNGWLIPLWNALERPDLRPEQVYVTAIAPRSRKGPHLHMKREGRFYVISGEVLMRGRYADGSYGEAVLGAGRVVKTFIALCGNPCALYNYGDTEALVINMPSPAWSAEDPDDHPVTDWKDPEGWPSR